MGGLFHSAATEEPAVSSWSHEEPCARAGGALPCACEQAPAGTCTSAWLHARRDQLSISDLSIGFLYPFDIQ